MTFHVKTIVPPAAQAISSALGFRTLPKELEACFLSVEPELQDLVLQAACVSRANYLEKKRTGRVVVPWTGKEAENPLYEVSPAFLAKIWPIQNDKLAHAFTALRKKGHVEIVKRVGNEKFYRATDTGSNFALHSWAHANFLLKKIGERLNQASFSH